jgi:hypothetical protein
MPNPWPAGDGECLTAGTPLHAAARGIQRGLWARRHRERDQVRRVPAVERQLLDPFVVDDGTDRRASRLDQWSAASTATCFRQLAERQRHVDDGIRIDGEGDACLCVGSESRQLGFEPIRPNRQIGQRVIPALVADRAADESSIGLRGGHVDARQHAAAFISDRARDLGR